MTPQVSDEAVAEATGRTFPEWFKLLDKAEAVTWSHAERAAWLAARGVDEWWAQSVTVEYERARGLRALGQRMDGTYEASLQRTLQAGPARIEALLREAGAALDPALAVVPRASDTNQGRVLRFASGDERVEIVLSARPDGRCVVRVTQGGLAGAEAREAAKARWLGVVEDLRARLGEA